MRMRMRVRVRVLPLIPDIPLVLRILVFLLLHRGRIRRNDRRSR
jgi:hypothetical protein